jgi:hypothetical protein
VTRPTQRPLPDKTQHSQEIDIHASGGTRTHNPSNRTAEDPYLRPRGQRYTMLQITAAPAADTTTTTTTTTTTSYCHQNIHQHRFKNSVGVGVDCVYTLNLSDITSPSPFLPLLTYKEFFIHNWLRLPPKYNVHLLIFKAFSSGHSDDILQLHHNERPVTTGCLFETHETQEKILSANWTLQQEVGLQTHATAI